MRRLILPAAVVCLWWLARPSAQDQPAPQTFRAGVDLVRIDATVLDKNRKPVRGLTAADFTVKEDGRPQRIVAIAEFDAAEADPVPTAWMRYAPRDVVSNTLADELGEGQAVAIVLDDFHTPDDSTEMAVSTREVARQIVDSLGPSDLAAVIFPSKPGRTQDFTRDRPKLLAAIDKYESEQPEFITLQPQAPGSLQGDMQRYSPTLGRDPCFQVQPVIPTLRAVTAQLATVPQRRKGLFFVSVGVPFAFTPGTSRCQGLLYDEMRRTFETAQRYNVNIHGIDPAGAAGYRRFIQQPRLRNARMVPGVAPGRANDIAHVRHDFLETLGEQTGGRPVVDTDDLQAAVAAIFEEYGSYYLIGYETTPNFDGRFRKVDVTIDRRDVEVRTRSGRWAPNKNDLVNDAGARTGGCVLDCWHIPPRPSEIQLTGLKPSEPLSLRAVAYPTTRAIAGPIGEPGAAGVAAVITVRLPAVLRPTEETLTVVRTIYDANERAGPPVAERFTRAVEPGAGDETRYDVWSRFTLPPGRYEVRFNATSRLANSSGTVHVEVVVPNVPKNGPAASPIVLGSDATGDGTDPFANILNLVPTTARDFTKGDRVTAVLRLFAPELTPLASVQVTASIIGGDGTAALEMPPSTIPPEAFAADGSADYRLELPLARLRPGLQLLSLSATVDATTVRRDLVFRVR